MAKEEASTASYLAFVDSAKRDARVWPTASQFEIAFDTPFNLVYGVDLLGVNVPRTEYTLSASRNQLVFSYGAPQERQKHVVVIPEGDYDAASFLVVLNSSLAMFPFTDGSTLVFSNVSAVASVANRLQVSSLVPFTLYLSESTIRVVLGFSDPVNPAYSGYAAPGWSTGAPDTVVSVPAAGMGSSALTALQASIPQVYEAVVNTSPYQQQFTSAFSGVITNVSFYVSAIGRPAQQYMQWQVVGSNGTDVFSSGTVQVNTDASMSNGTVVQTVTPLLAGTSYILQITDKSNGDTANCFTVGVNSALLTVRAAADTVTAPGIIDLTGERYIMLRCLELETAINSSRAFEQGTAGVGLIQLGTVGYSSQAYDYTAYPSRTFGPIGSLSKLTLSFRKADGQLYDFKGLNLQLQLLIKFLMPSPVDQASRFATRPYLADMTVRRLQAEIEADPRYAWVARPTR